jgi:hypothetical protein
MRLHNGSPGISVVGAHLCVRPGSTRRSTTTDGDASRKFPESLHNTEGQLNLYSAGKTLSADGVGLAPSPDQRLSTAEPTPTQKNTGSVGFLWQG